MANVGVAPLDPLTTTGQFRLAYGDTEYIDLDPPVVGYGDYTELSDEEIETFLSQGSDNVTRAIGYYFLRLSGRAALKSKMVKDYDLQVDLTKRAEDLRKQAQFYFDQADAEDIAAGLTDFFTSIPFRTEGDIVPELAAYPYPAVIDID